MIDQLPQPSTRLYTVEDASASFDEFKRLCEQKCREEDYPLAQAVEKNIPVYDLAQMSPSDTQRTAALQDEWYHILHSGPGVFVLKAFYPNTHSIDQINTVFDSVIASEATGPKGDHFAASGNNARIWNSFQKHAVRSPGTFVQYYSNPWLSQVSSAWLGEGYQVTAQVNIVRPGGLPQTVHRDYHLGFQTGETCARVPKGMQIASQFLTLQGAIAHSDMPLESGPTRFLPFSQRLEEGYMAYRLQEYQAYFDDHWVSLPLSKGDAVFFNPALFHAAGHNTTTDVDRSANLLQISSPFGRAMETVDTCAVIESCWEDLGVLYKKQGFNLEVQALVAAIASGYAFPTNLDNRPPAPGGMAPESEADIVVKGLKAGWSKDKIVSALKQIRNDSAA